MTWMKQNQHNEKTTFELIGGETLPLKLTQPQRDVLLSCTRLRRAIKRKIETTEAGIQVAEFSGKELAEMDQEITASSVFAPPAEKKRLIAIQKKIIELLDEDHEDASLKTRRTASRTKANDLFQFKITLANIKPPIWRRVQVPDYTLASLHEVIQVVMGWQNCHLHLFIIDGERYGPQLPNDFEDELNMKDEDAVLLSEIVPKDGKRFRFVYEYDFGDGWQHEVLFEGFPKPESKAKHPCCLEGARCCPPEDVGGPWGYDEFLRVIANPKHECHEEMLDWIGGSFDPDEFDLNDVNRQLKSRRR